MNYCEGCKGKIKLKMKFQIVDVEVLFRYNTDYYNNVIVGFLSEFDISVKW